MLDSEANQKHKLEEEIAILRSQLLQLSFQADEVGGYKLICLHHSSRSTELLHRQLKFLNVLIIIILLFCLLIHHGMCHSVIVDIGY